MNNLRTLPSDSCKVFGRDDIEQSISSRFERLARHYPDGHAVSARGGQYSYDQLNRAANRLARVLLTHHRNKDLPVALFLEQGAPQIMATLGALKAGCFYVPIDPSNPLPRNQFMLRDSTAALIITNDNNLDTVMKLSANTRQVVNIDQAGDNVPDDNLEVAIAPGDLAYILYTSGSTGHPKGIVQNHRNVIHNVMRHTNAFGIGHADRQTLLYTSSVYGGQRDMFNALLNGASLHVYVVKNEGVEGLAEWLALNRISIYCSVTTVFRQLANTLSGQEKFDHIRLIKLGGEATSKREVDAYKKYFPATCVMHCGLGSTETGLVRNYFISKSTPIAGNTVPLGYPIADLDILLLDESGQPQATGALGEMAVRSRYISLGYWQRPQLTRQTFMPDPDDDAGRIYRTGDMGYLHPDGMLEHRGRRDFQVKIRGNRIDTTEVEMALLGFPSIKEAVVVGLKDHQGIDELAAYLVGSGEDRPSANDLWQKLAGTLPDFMLPSYFTWLASLPLLPNGKIDRPALPKPEMAAREQRYTPPATDIEKTIAGIWREILAVERIGIMDNFFVIGGHSLLAAQAIARINRAYDIRLPLSTLFDQRTIAGLAQAVMCALTKRLSSLDMATVLGNIEALTDAEAARLLADNTKGKAQ